MKINKASLILFYIVMVTINVCGQHIEKIEGNLDSLKIEKRINTEFTYENMSVGKYDRELEFITNKQEEYNKREPGRGDNWARKWVDDRKEKFEPKFNEMLQKESELVITGSKNDARYTIIFHTFFTEPGFSAGWPVRKRAEISGEALLVEAGDKSKIIAKINIEKAPGGEFAGFDFDTGVRITAAYGKAGAALGKFLKKELK